VCAAATGDKEAAPAPVGLRLVRRKIAHTQRFWRGLRPWKRIAVGAVFVVLALVELGGSGASVRAASEIGEWSAPSAWPIVAVHMSVEPDGSVFALDGFGNAPNSEKLWNPTTGVFTAVPYARNLFCAGHIQLADGRTLLVGGHINADEGLADTTIFNPSNNTYFRGPDMSVGRWYPTAIELPDGRVFAFAGDNIVQDRPGQPPPFSDASVNSLPEVYNPTTNTWTDLDGAKLTTPLYPFLFIMSDGRIFNAGPDKTTRIIDPATWTWSTVGQSPIDGMSAVMYRPNKVMKSGTWADPDFNGANAYNANGGTAVIDLNAQTPTWRSTASMAFGRSYQNLTMLADGTVLASGGMSTSDGTDLTKAVLPAEIWNPDTETWTTVASLTDGREYHSTAVLLKDGRVLMAGGGALPGRATDIKTGEIYSPPYLFKGARPTITSAPATANYGDSFDVTTPNAAQIQKVSLIRMSSTTHALNMNQNFQFLNFTVGSGKVTLQAPANANLAPPGDYLLFLLDTNGVPSVGSVIRIADTSPPSAPSNLTATGSPGQVSLSWTASSDNGGIAHYNVHRSTTSGFTPSAANRIAQPVGANYVDTSLAAGTYYYKVIAEDGAGNLSQPSNEASATVLGGPPVASYGFDAGSGATTADQSGHGNNGTISNATWAATGKFGKALSFNGTNASVSVPDSASLDLTTGMTLEAWVNPTVSSGFRTLVVKEQPGNLVYGVYSSSDTNRPQSQVTVGGTARLLNGTATLPTGTWSHVAATYDGTTQRLYVNGTQVSTLAVSGSIATSNSPLKIGGNSIWSEWFNGLIDEVRVYDRPLSAAEITADMNTSITSPDGVPPSAPGTLSATGGLGSVSLSWGAATDNVGVVKYNVHRSTTSGFTPSAANRIAQPTGTTYTDSGLAAGTYYYKVTAEDAAGNVGPPSNEASATATSDTIPPTAPTNLTANASNGQVALAWGASSDAGGIARYNVHRSTTTGFTPTAANRIAQPTGTSYNDVGVPAGTYYYKVTAEDPAGNVSQPSNEASATLQAPPPVAAYGFDAGSGTTAADQSGNGNNGTITNATWAATGKFGKALSFNGTNASVSVPDTASLDLTSGMTIEGWVNPNSASGYRTMIVKEMPGDLVYGLYANSDTNRPESQVRIGTPRLLAGTAAVPTGTWTHLAATYDGTTERLFVNGTQVSSLAVAGTITTSTSPLKIGGNSIWSEWFNGLIDEVRVYNRALSAAEIQADMNTSISPSDTQPPSAPGTLTATGTLTTAQLSWGAATDNVGVVRYNVHRSTTPNFTPTAANRIAQPTGTSYTDTVAAGTYYYKVTAEDAAGNVGPPSNEATATVGDTAPPSAPGTLTATGAVGKATLNWGAATDNVGVVRYNVHRSTTPGFTPSAANRIAQPSGTSYVDTVAAGTYYYKVTAEDAAGNVGPPSNEATAVVTTDTTPPTAPFLTGSVTGGTVNLSWSGSTDDVGVVRYNVHRGTTPGFTPTAANRIAQPTGTSYADSGLSPGTYFYKVTAEDAAGNVSLPSNELLETVADGTPPTAPTGLAANVVGTTVNLSWNAASDDVGVVRYNVHRGATAGFTPSAANRIGQPTGTTFSDPGLAAGTYYYKVTAEDAAGNVGPVSNTANATVPDTTPPGAPTGLGATGGAGQVGLSWTAATDDVGVVRYNVHRSVTAGFTPTAANRIAQPTGTSYTDLGLAAGTYYYKVTAEDAAGNVGPASNEANATVTQPPPSGLVAAYGFDTGSGTVAPDQSGNGNNGTLTNATWAGAGAGKYGDAVSFNGTNAYVSVPHTASLALTTAMTLDAWVKPTTLSAGDWNTVVFKERTGYYGWALYANTGNNRPSANAYTTADHDLRGTSQVSVGVWTHLAATYDGNVLALYVNGTQVATTVATGNLISATGALKIGGNAIWGEYFNGLIDEVRVYNRALSAAEIQADMNTSITSPDGIPPSAPGTLTATGGLGQVSLSWGAATDNVGVLRYNLHRSTTPGFTPSTANRIAQPTGLSYTDTGLAAGTYYYKVTAEDAAGNVGPPSNEANAVATADTTAPTVSITSPTSGATVSGSVSVNANASDNGTVAGVQFKLDGVNLGAEDTTSPYSISWDTFTAANGAHTLTALARDGAGNTTLSTGVPVTVQNTAAAGLVGAWAFDEGTGTTVADQSGKGNNGTVANGTWVTTGRFNNAISFNGTSTRVTIPDSATLDLTTGMTLEAWVRPSIVGNWQTAVVKEQSGNLVYGMYANTNLNRPEGEVYVNGATRVLNGTSILPTGTWSYLTATYDGANLRLYLNGAQVAQVAQTGSILTSTQPLRIGSNAIWGEYFNGLIDEVRVYNRALSTSEIQTDMNRSVTPDITPPTITSKTPANGASGVNVGSSVTATFSELMNSGTITPSNFQLKDASNASVPVNVSYDPATNIATLSPQTALQYGATYTATVKGGSGGVSDFAGNALASDVSWSFTTESSPPQILVVESTANKFDSYAEEILRNEGLGAFTTIDATFLSPALLAGFDLVVLGDMPLNASQVTTLSGWVSAGGNLVALHPSKLLAGLLGLTDAGTTLSNAYLKVDTTTQAGAGIVGQTIQFHGSADRYTLNGASAIATLYSDANTATSNPAVTLRSVGSSGGQAAAFTYDLARSVVYTRQGNPAWAGQERDGVSGIRPDDMFYGAKTGDVQPDWIDTNKIAIPQADEQQRLLVNLMTLMERDKMPLPHFWYLPRGKKAVVLLSGDDHSPSQAQGGTASNFNRFKTLSAAGCVVANWECIRATSYIYPDSVLTNAQAAGFITDGFEVGLHPVFGACPTTPITQDELSAGFDQQLAQFHAKYTSVPGPVTNRTHCVFWPDWASNAKVELAHGIRLDANYYHYPGSWIGTKPGFLTGGGFPMRFADSDGTTIDVYQQNVNETDESTSAFLAQMNTLLDNALGSQGYYGAFGTLVHTDNPAPLQGFEDIVASAQAHGVPLISYKQMLDWVDGRNASTIRSMSWSAGTFSFATTVGGGANGLQTMLPTQGPSGTLSALSCNGSAKTYTVQTIKGISYAMFDTVTGTCQATYS
jgi:fibronectin type 3 domain-containing protein